MRWQTESRIPTVVSGSLLTRSGPQGAAEGDGLVRGRYIV